MTKDTLFNSPKPTTEFQFNSEVASVFNDMITRSTPLYPEIQKCIAEITKEIITKNSNIYDLGCSTGTTLNTISPICTHQNATLIGIDYSQDMLDQCKKNLTSNKNTKLICHDLNTPITLSNASLVILNLTLQFIAPQNRPQLLDSIYKGLNPNGALILIEKVKTESPDTQDLFTNIHHNLKKQNGYSDLEIAQKRDAIETILIPQKDSKNIQLLQNAGFQTIETFFKWFNFSGLIALK